MDINTSSLLFLQRQKSLATFSSANDFSTATGGPGNWLTATKILACSQSMHRYWAAFTAIFLKEENITRVNCTTVTKPKAYKLEILS